MGLETYHVLFSFLRFKTVQSWSPWFTITTSPRPNRCITNHFLARSWTWHGVNTIHRWPMFITDEFALLLLYFDNNDLIIFISLKLHWKLSWSFTCHHLLTWDNFCHLIFFAKEWWERPTTKIFNNTAIHLYNALYVVVKISVEKPYPLPVPLFVVVYATILAPRPSLCHSLLQQPPVFWNSPLKILFPLSIIILKLLGNLSRSEKWCDFEAW